MVIFDANIFLYVLSNTNAPVIHPESKEQVENVSARISFLIACLSKRREKIGIPTPALAEILVRSSDATTEILRQLSKENSIQILPFDMKAAIELAEMTRLALSTRERRNVITEAKQKIKLDRQIVAIAKCSGASKIYTNDKGLANFARDNGIEPTFPWVLPLPPEYAQYNLDV